MAATTTPRKSAASKARPKHPLQDAIPAPERHEGYVSRYFDGFKDLDLLEYADDSNYNVLMYGPTGPGKTRCVEAYSALGPANSRGTRSPKPLALIACNGGMDPSTTWGQFRKTEDGKIVFQEAAPLGVIRHGGTLYIDEINFAHPRIVAQMHPLLDDRRSLTIPELGGETIKAHPDLFIVASYNPDYQGTRPLNEAFKNRFAIKLHYDYDTEVEEQILSGDGVSVQPLLDLATKLRAMTADGTLATPVSTNMIRDFITIGVDTTYDFAVMNFVNTFHIDEQQAVKNAFDLNRDELEGMITLVEEARNE